MACITKSNQIFFAIVTGSAAKFLVVNLKVGHLSAYLASPTVAAQHLVPELLVQNGVQP